MALAIATNNAALNAAASASSVNRDMETSMARLSSGKRINSASDDAAGVAISSRLSAEIRGTDQAIRNALDGQALIDTAEGAHSEIENILQRMREVSVQAANDTNNNQDRANLQAEMSALVTEIDRIAGTTTWAGEKLMEAESGTKFSFQVGAKTSNKNQIEININGMGAHALGLQADSADVQRTLSEVIVGQSINTVDYDPALQIRQGSISSGVVTANNGNTSITLPMLGAIAGTDQTPAISTVTSANDTITLNAAALAAGFTLTLESGKTVTATAGETTQQLADKINAGTGAVKTGDAIAGDAGHGYSATVSGDVITLTAAGAITETSSGVTEAAGSGTMAGVAVSTVSGTTTFGDVTYDPTDSASVNAAAAAINAGTATTNIVATVGADGSGNAGKIVLSHNDGSGSDHTTATGLGTHTNISNLQGLVAFDTANTVPFATMQVSGTTGILTFNENATSINLVLGKTTATGAAGAKSSITIDATADLQTAVDAINNGGGSVGAGTAEHGYTASIVAAPGGGSLAGTIKLVQGTKHADLTQTSLANLIDNGANGVGAIAKQQPAAPGLAQDMDVKTLPKALEAIVAVDEAIKTVNIQRSTLGAVSNRLSHTINNLTNISTNLSAAQGGIEDADFAHETTMLAKNQILQQASTAMLAQANASKQNVLSLLQG